MNPGHLTSKSMTKSVGSHIALLLLDRCFSIMGWAWCVWFGNCVYDVGIAEVGLVNDWAIEV